ncbi:GNAT family N-acetyltransferase [Hyphococcus flavus]|uniref:GNAT family N-acetyltransferase n=1 Tax=Hyphococcus flavus TaxID=1866326 RepID=A0AAE9ZGC1_9PROT|nr:GNAT family N-acetyltransferase [Hyphococcus flavus]WDI32433.1 GNAT family N-acetyltransferase [Hyphococcus flavus]
MDTDIYIRRIEESDVDELFTQMTALAENEGEQAHLTVTPAVLRQTGFRDAPSWSGFFALSGDKTAGYATYTHDFHVWTGSPRITLDDIYVRPECRGLGFGERLMSAVFDEAKKTGAYVNWTVRTDNKKAIAFYQRLGATYRVIGKCGWRADAPGA